MSKRPLKEQEAGDNKELNLKGPDFFKAVPIEIKEKKEYKDAHGNVLKDTSPWAHYLRQECLSMTLEEQGTKGTDGYKFTVVCISTSEARYYTNTTLEFRLRFGP